MDKRPSQLQHNLLQWIENIERTDLTLAERLNNIESLVNCYARENNLDPVNVTATMLSNLLGCSLPHAMNYLAVMRADHSLRALISDNKIKNLEKASIIAALASPELKQTAIEQSLRGASLKYLKALLAQDKRQKTSIDKSLNRRSVGRSATRITLGATTNIKVAKLFLTSILQQQKFSHLRNTIKIEVLDDFKSYSIAFKRLLNNLEQIVD